MFKDIFKSVCLSLLIIVLLHYLFNYLQDSLTVPKVKDLVERPKEKYDSIMKVVNTETEQPTMTNTQNYNETDSLNMQSELNNYVSQINSQGNLETSAVSNMNQVPIEQTDGRFSNLQGSANSENTMGTSTANNSAEIYNSQQPQQPTSSHESTNIDSLPSI